MHRLLMTSSVLALCASIARADSLEPGSVLVYPVFSTPASISGFTVVSVTNTNEAFGGATNVHFEFVHAATSPGFTTCTVFDRVEFLTPADTLSVLVSCFDPIPGARGYLVVHAEDPQFFARDWSHNYLVGSEFLFSATGVTAAMSLPAISLSAMGLDKTLTDLDLDSQLDFDGIEYEGIPDRIILDCFVASPLLDLVLINLTGGVNHTAVVQFTIFNDNEFPLSATSSFECWVERPLTSVSKAFDANFLRFNTPDDPSDLDLDCNGVGEAETGWARIDGIIADSGIETIPNPALLGALTGLRAVDGGRPMWHSRATQSNGDFLKVGLDDPEHP